MNTCDSVLPCVGRSSTANGRRLVINSQLPLQAGLEHALLDHHFALARRQYPVLRDNILVTQVAPGKVERRLGRVAGMDELLVTNPLKTFSGLSPEILTYS